jgi:hypothetical protein
MEGKMPITTAVIDDTVAVGESGTSRRGLESGKAPSVPRSRFALHGDAIVSTTAYSVPS